MDFPLKEVLDHLPVIGGTAFALYWLAKRIIEARNAAKGFVSHIVDEKMPSVIKAVLSNGINDLVNRQNEAQDKRWMEAMEAKFKEHEAREEATYKRLLEQGKRGRKR